ncbi:MAG: flagellar biosynthesis protein FlhF [Sulfobacillus thermotolerans]|nr:flagellar biosynthesis protein FlhF [Sulfobacillus thermotolerans]
MIVKRFSGQTVEEALIRAKWELGDEAVLLSSGPAKDRWWKVWEKGYHVLAATDYPVSKNSRGTLDEPHSAHQVAAGQSQMVERIQTTQDERWDAVLKLLSQVDRKIDQAVPVASGAGEWYDFLLERELPPEWARRLAQKVPSEGTKESQHEALQRSAAEHLMIQPVLPLTRPQAVIVVIGPTGAGKTTTIAKLATYARLELGRSVLLVTTDTYRVAAVEQLKTFGGILDVPVAVANRPQDLPAIIREHSPEVVFVDTPGHSLSQPMQIRQSQSVMKYAHATDVLLCMPATASRSLFVKTAQTLAGDHAVSLCLTKVDEVLSPGTVLGALMDLQWPLAYIAHGQNVPEDIGPASADGLAQWLMRGGAYHG